MNVLVVGSGGREHALAWKIAQSARVDEVFVAPGNAGTAVDAVNVDLSGSDFYGLVRFWRDHSRASLVLILGALVLTAPLSPPAAAILILMLVLQAVFIGRSLFQGQFAQNRRLWITLGGVILLILIGIWLSWSRFAPEGVTNPLALIGWWVRKSAQWQAHLSERASGWVQRIFEDGFYWRDLHHISRIHHGYSIHELGYQAHIVTDQDHRNPQTILNIHHRLGYYPLHDDIQRAGKLIGDHQGRAECNAHGDANALLHTTAQFMRIHAVDATR